MKKVFIVLGVFAALIAVVIISFPFIVNLNKYKAQIEEEVKKRINGEFKLEKIGFRGFGIQVKNIVLSSAGNFAHKEILNVGEVKIKISLLSLLTANPKVTVILRKPQIYLVKDTEGILNITALPKKELSETPDVGALSNKSGSSKLPALILGAKISFVASSALLKYIDEKSHSESAFENLEISLNNVSLNSPIDFNLSANLSSRGAFEEKISLKGKAKLLTEGSRQLKGADLDAKLGLGDQEVSLKGNISSFETLETNLNISANKLAIEKLKNAITSLKKYSIKGIFSLNGEVKGPLKNFKECVVSAKSDLQISSKQTDLLIKTTFSETLAHLKGNMSIESGLVNLDDFFTPSKSEREGFLMAMAYAESEVSSKNPLAIFRTNSILKGLFLDGNINIQKMIYKKTDFNNVKGEFNLEDLQFSLSKFRMDAFKGILNVKGEVRLDTQEPTYQMTLGVDNLQANAMVSMFSPTLKDVLFGILNANIVMSGEGLGFEKIKRRLLGSGKIELKEVELKGLNMGKEVQEKLKLISIFSGSDILNEKLDSKIHFVRSSLSIKEGKLWTPDAVLEAPVYKANMKGYTSFDKDMDYQGNILIPAKKLSSSLASMADSNGMVAFPFTLTGHLPRFAFSVDAAKVAQMALRSTLRDTIQKKAKEKLGIDLPVDLPF